MTMLFGFYMIILVFAAPVLAYIFFDAGFHLGLAFLAAMGPQWFFSLCVLLRPHRRHWRDRGQG